MRRRPAALLPRRPSSAPPARRRRARRARTRRGAALTVWAILSTAPSVEAEVGIDGDLFLGVWSPQRTRFVASVPVCVSRSPDEVQGAYRLTVSSATGNVPGEDFVLLNGVGDAVPYRVRWFADGPDGPAERLRPGVASRRSYPYRTPTECLEGRAASLEARVRARDVARAPAGVYDDTLVLTVSPI